MCHWKLGKKKHAMQFLWQIFLNSLVSHFSWHFAEILILYTLAFDSFASTNFVKQEHMS